MAQKYTLADWRKATLSNGLMFRLVMEKPELCRKLLERVLDMKIRKVTNLEAEKSIETKMNAHGIRLDIYIEDDKGNAYDVEMQVGQSYKEALGRRTRYYQSMMDGDALKKGTDYWELRPSFIIFICTFDPFTENLGRYTFKSQCLEKPELGLNDYSTKVFINTKGDRHKLSKELASLMDYINDGNPTDEYTKEINAEVETLRKDDGKGELMMTWEQTIREHEYMARNEGVEVGRQEGMQAGRQEEKIENAKSMLRKGKFTVEDIADVLGLNVADVKELQKKILH